MNRSQSRERVDIDSSRKRKIFVGNLPMDILTGEIKDLFSRHGKVIDVTLKHQRGPPFAFVEFDDHRDAMEAIVRFDGSKYAGKMLRVEFSKGDGLKRDRGFERNPLYRGYNSEKILRSSSRVMISGLPGSGSWQDIKDHMRSVGEVCYANVYGDGVGVAEFTSRHYMRDAIKKLDRSSFLSHKGEKSTIRVREAKYTDQSRSRSRCSSESSSSESTNSRVSHTSPGKRRRRRSRSRSRSPARC